MHSDDNTKTSFTKIIKLRPYLPKYTCKNFNVYTRFSFIQKKSIEVKIMLSVKSMHSPLGIDSIFGIQHFHREQCLEFVFKVSFNIKSENQYK